MRVSTVAICGKMGRRKLVKSLKTKPSHCRSPFATESHVQALVRKWQVRLPLLKGGRFGSWLETRGDGKHLFAGCRACAAASDGNKFKNPFAGYTTSLRGLQFHHVARHQRSTKHQQSVATYLAETLQAGTTSCVVGAPAEDRYRSVIQQLLKGATLRNGTAQDFRMKCENMKATLCEAMRAQEREFCKGSRSGGIVPRCS